MPVFLGLTIGIAGVLGMVVVMCVGATLVVARFHQRTCRGEKPFAHFVVACILKKKGCVEVTQPFVSFVQIAF